MYLLLPTQPAAEMEKLTTNEAVRSADLEISVGSTSSLQRFLPSIEAPQASHMSSMKVKNYNSVRNQKRVN